MNEIILHPNSYSDDVICPHCGTPHMVEWVYESEGQIEGHTYPVKVWCEECENHFTIEQVINVTYKIVNATS